MMKVLCTRAADCESGATAMEYALTAAILSVALLTGAGTVGTALKDQFGLVSHKMAGISAQESGPGGGASMVSRQLPADDEALADTKVSWQ